MSAFSSDPVVSLRSVDSSITGLMVASVTCGAGDDMTVEGCTTGVAVAGDCDAGGSTVIVEVAIDGIGEVGLSSDAGETLGGDERC